MKNRTSRKAQSGGSKPKKVKLKTRISDVIESAMKVKGLSKDELAAKLGVTYETIRTAVNGEKVPSRFLTKALAEVLDEDVEKFENLRISDSMRDKYGDVPLLLSGKNPELDPIDRVWSHLSAEHKQDIIAMTQTYAKRDRETAR